ncbi:MAG: phage portal protein family protein [Verrucomicrobiales bacterium]
MRNFTPARLVRALESFDLGHLREFALMAETIAERDDTLKSVKPKREKEVSQLERQVLVKKNSGAEGEAHREVLEDFWNNVKVVNAFDRNERGGFRRLVKQMMTAVSFRYAVHHLVWDPRHGRLRATFEFVPLWMFENRTGTLRYLEGHNTTEGVPLDPGQWMVTCADGLMIACSIGYSAKRNAFNDWLIFSEKFSVPGILGRTSAKKDSPEGQMMRSAVESFGHDWVGVLYGDDGTHQKPIELVQAQGNPNGMPMPAVVERVDRKFAALYRGADLSTMSAGSGEGTGASLQGEEKEILLSDDAETINETLAEVSRKVIEWYFGEGVEPQADVLLVVPTDDDDQFYLESTKAAKEMGVRVSTGAFCERLGIQEAEEGEAALGDITEPSEAVENALVMREESEAQRLREAFAADVHPLGDALFTALNAGDGAATRAALKKINTDLPSFMEGEALADYLQEEMLAALEDDGFEGLGGGEVEANAGTSEGAKKGWVTRRKNGWRPNEAKAELGKYFEDTFSGEERPIMEYAEVSAEQAQMILAKTGVDVSGYRHAIDQSAIRHLIRSHGDPKKEERQKQVALSKGDVERLAEDVTGFDEVEFAGMTKQGLQAIRYYKDRPDGTTVVIEAVRSPKYPRLVPETMFKKKEAGWRRKSK